MTTSEWFAALAVQAGQALVLRDGDVEVARSAGTWARSGSTATVTAKFESAGMQVTSVETASGAVLESFDDPVSLPFGFVWDYSLSLKVG